VLAGGFYRRVCVGGIFAGAVQLRNTPRPGAAGTLRRPGIWLAAATAASSLAYALPLALVSGSAEFRYLAWPVLATLCSLWLIAWPPVARAPRSGLA